MRFVSALFVCVCVCFKDFLKQHKNYSATDQNLLSLKSIRKTSTAVQPAHMSDLLSTVATSCRAQG